MRQYTPEISFPFGSASCARALNDRIEPSPLVPPCAQCSGTFLLNWKTVFATCDITQNGDLAHDCLMQTEHKSHGAMKCYYIL